MSWKKLFNLPSTPEMDTSPLPGITTETAFGNDYENILRQKMLTGWSSPEEKAASLRFKEMPIDKSYKQDMGDVAVNLAGRGMTNSGANEALMERAMLKRSQSKEKATQDIAEEEKGRQYETMGMAGSYATNKLNAIQTAEIQKQNMEIQRRNTVYQNALMRFQKKMFAWQTGANIIGTGLGMWAGGAFSGGGGAGTGVGSMKFFGGSTPPVGQNYSPNY